MELPRGKTQVLGNLLHIFAKYFHVSGALPGAEDTTENHTAEPEGPTRLRSRGEGGPPGAVAGVTVGAPDGAPTARPGPMALTASLPRDVTQPWTLWPAQSIWQEETVFPLPD